MSNIVQLTKNGSNEYPITVPEAVVDSKGKTVKDKIESIENRIKDLIVEGGGYDDSELRALIEDISVEVENRQETLVSGENIKTINGKTLLGAGNITIEGGGDAYDDTELRDEIGRIEEEVEVEKDYTERRFASTLETLDMLSGAFDSFSKGITPTTVQTMALLIGDESLQFKFTSSINSLEDIKCPLIYSNETKKMYGNSACLVHMTLDVDSITPAEGRDITDYKRWSISAFNEKLEDTESRYVYVKASKNSTDAEYLLSPVSIKMEEVDEYYHFLVGILNSEYNGLRDFVTLYGFTEVLPGQITTGVIKSADGNTYFDLQQGVICGNITFKTNAGTDASLADFEEEYKQTVEDIDQTIEDAKNTANDYINIESTRLQGLIQNLDNAKANLNDVYSIAVADGKLSELEQKAYKDAKSLVDQARIDLIEEINGLTGLVNTIQATTSNLDSMILDLQTGVEQSIKEINDKLDGVVESYYDKYTPTRENEPARTWIIEGTEEDHIGDTFTNTLTEGDGAGKSWRWLMQDDGTYDWQLIADSDVTKALAAAATAQATADGKMSVFLDKPTKYGKGDLWIVDDSYIPTGFKIGDILTATQDSSFYVESHWAKLINYANSESVQSAIQNAINELNEAQKAITDALKDDIITLSESVNTINEISEAAQLLATAASSNASEAINKANTAQQVADDAKIVADNAQSLADAAQAFANTAEENARKAQEEADEAKEIAEGATTKLTNWSEDNIISPFEKQGIRDELAFIIADNNDIYAQVVRYELSDTEAYIDFVDQYMIYKSDLETIVNSTSESVDVPQDMRIHQEDYYTGRTQILGMIADIAKQISDDAKETAINSQKIAYETALVAEAISQEVSTLHINIDYVKEQVDGMVVNYYLKGAPKIDNYPTISWFTDIEKLNHVGDAYINIATKEQDSINAGKAWKWSKNNSGTGAIAGTDIITVSSGTIVKKTDTYVGRLNTSYVYQYVQLINSGVQNTIKDFIYNQYIEVYSGPTVKVRIDSDGSVYVFDELGRFVNDEFTLKFYRTNDIKIINSDGNETFLTWNPIKDPDELKALYDAYAARNEVYELGFLMNAFKDGETYTHGGVVLSDMVAVKDNGKVEAFINGSDYGIDNNHGKLLIAAGIEDITKPDKANTRIYEDGTTITNKMKLRDGCEVGDVTIKDNGVYVNTNNGGSIRLSKRGLYAYQKDGSFTDIGSCGSEAITISGKDNYAGACYVNEDTYKIAAQINAADGYHAIHCLSGVFAGLRTKTRVITTTGSSANPHILSELDFDVLVNQTNNSLITYIQLPGGTSELLDGQEYIVTTKGAKVVIQSYTNNICAIEDANISANYLNDSWGTYDKKAKKGVFRIKYYKAASQWIISWIDKYE